MFLLQFYVGDILYLALEKNTKNEELTRIFYKQEIGGKKLHYDDFRNFILQIQPIKIRQTERK